MNKINQSRDIANASPSELVLAVHGARRGRFELPTKHAAGPIVHAEINHGRWVVQCPEENCGGAELADVDEPWFFCLSCYNAGAGGAWLPVQFPSRREDIESALLQRKREHNRNWLPHETVLDLLAENRAHDGEQRGR